MCTGYTQERKFDISMRNANIGAECCNIPVKQLLKDGAHGLDRTTKVLPPRDFKSMEL